jgi:hypothetical protein
MDIVKSVNGVAIRLTGERWLHIVENHNEIAGLYYDILDTIANPDLIVNGYEGELIALRKINGKKHLVIIYKETGKDDGFIITAFFSSRIGKLKRRKILWKREEH